MESREGKFTKVVRPNKVNDEVIGIILAGAVISLKMLYELEQGY